MYIDDVPSSQAHYPRALEITTTMCALYFEETLTTGHDNLGQW